MPQIHGMTWASVHCLQILDGGGFGESYTFVLSSSLFSPRFVFLFLSFISLSLSSCFFSFFFFLSCLGVREES